MEDYEIKACLDKVVKNRIERVFRPLLEEHYKPTDAPPWYWHFAFLTLFFCLIDFLGYLHKGKSSSKNAVCFLRRYFGEVNPSYQKVGGLLYHMYRHGNVHELEPKIIQLKDGTRVSWVIESGTVRSSSSSHLTGFKADGTARLHISLHSLCNDLNSAVDIYYEDLCKDPVLRRNFEDAVEKLHEPEDEVEVEKRRHIRRSDFDFIKNLPDFVAEG